MSQGTNAAAPAPESLVARCQEGDREAFGALFELYRDAVYSLALHFLGNESLAADVTQEVFLKLLTQVRRFRREAEFKTWLYRVVANTCVSQHRHAARFVALDESFETAFFVGEPRQEHEAVHRQMRAELRVAVLRLGLSLRLPLLLRYVAGLSYAEIGRALGIPVGTAASRIERARKAVGAELAHFRSARKR